MFHEFGHALQRLVRQRDLSAGVGHQMWRATFVEFPSQFNEHWALHPEVLKHYAVNIKTGRAYPANSGGQDHGVGEVGPRVMPWVELLAASQLDMQWHTLPAGCAEAGPWTNLKSRR